MREKQQRLKEEIRQFELARKESRAKEEFINAGVEICVVVKVNNSSRRTKNIVEEIKSETNGVARCLFTPLPAA